MNAQLDHGRYAWTRQPKPQATPKSESWSWHTEGHRAWVLEEDGTTVCEIVVPQPGNAARVAAQIVAEHNEGVLA